MAGSEAAVGLERIEQSDAVAAPTSAVQGGRHREQAGEVDWHGAISRINLECAAQTLDQLVVIAALGRELGLQAASAVERHIERQGLKAAFDPHVEPPPPQIYFL